MPPVRQEESDRSSYAIGLCVGRNTQPASRMTDTSEPVLSAVFVDGLRFETSVRREQRRSFAPADAIQCLGPAIKFFVCERY